MIKQIFKIRPPLFRVAFGFNDFNTKPNLYTLLQVKPNATAAEIRYHYYKVMSKYQPDGSKQGEGQKHSRLLNEAFAILSNQTLRAKYDKQNGFDKKIGADNPTQKINMSKDTEMDKEYNEARRGFSAIIGDKKTRFQEKIFIIAGATILFSTVLLLLNGKSYKKQFLQKSEASKQQS